MLELRTLGTTDLRDVDGRRVESVLVHHKRTALLAYLCASNPPRMHRRATLVALLWPEADEEHARGALRHELSQLRRSLGPGVLLGEGGESIGVDRERLWCDLWAFESALDARKLEEALDLWHGEFLPGLKVPGGEFDRWLDEERARLARRVADAGRRLSVQAEEEGDPTRAISWARRLTELAPYDESGWQRLLVLLDRVGDRSGALTVYEALAARMRQDLEVEPSPETRALVERIRGRQEVFATAVDGGPVAAPTPLSADTGQAVSAILDAPPTAPHHAAAAAPSTRPPFGRRLRPMLFAGLGIVVVVLAFNEVGTRWSDSGRAVIELPRLDNPSGDATIEILRHRIEDELGDALSSVEFVELIEAGNPQRVTAQVSGSLYQRGELVEARLRVVEPGAGGRVIGMTPPVLLSPLDPDPGIDSLVVSVLVALAVQYDPRFDASGGLAPRLGIRLPLYEAYLQYVRGSDLFGAQDYAAAVPLLLKAYEIDPGFGKAAVFAAIAMAMGGQPAAADSFASALLVENDSLTDFERSFGEWFLADLKGRRADAYRAANDFERAADGTSPSAVAVAAREATRLNRPREALRKYEHVSTEHGWLRSYTVLWEEWAGAFHMVGDHGGELDKALEGRARFPESLGMIRAEVRARAALQQADQVQRLVEETLTLSTDGFGPAEVAWVGAQELAAHGQDSAASATRRTALEWLANCEPPTPEEVLIQARLLLELGNVESAEQVLGTLPPLRDLNWLALKGMVAAQRGDTAAAREVLAQLEAMDNPYLSGRHLLHASGIRAALGEPELAVQTLRRALAAGLGFGVELHALPILSPLAGRRDFEAILRPRG